MTSLYRAEVISSPREDRICTLCRTGEIDKLHLGELIYKEGISVHHFCLFFCSNLPQRGGDLEGIEGFLIPDILREAKRVLGNSKRQSRALNFYRCRFCRKPGATIGCCHPNCNLIFHFPCGIKNSVLYKFDPNYEAFCNRHADRSWIRSHLKIDRWCRICEGSVVTKKNYFVIGSCCPISVVHKECIQEYALSAGSFFKCPCCADTKIYWTEAQLQGVYTPERDASWEADPNAYADLNRLYNHCDMPGCPKPNLKTTDTESGWFMLRCQYCAASATHIRCWTSDKLTCRSKWTCEICTSVDQRIENYRRQESLLESVDWDESASVSVVNADRWMSMDTDCETCATESLSSFGVSSDSGNSPVNSLEAPPSSRIRLDRVLEIRLVRCDEVARVPMRSSALGMRSRSRGLLKPPSRLDL